MSNKLPNVCQLRQTGHDAEQCGAFRLGHFSGLSAARTLFFMKPTILYETMYLLLMQTVALQRCRPFRTYTEQQEEEFARIRWRTERLSWPAVSVPTIWCEEVRFATNDHRFPRTHTHISFVFGEGFDAECLAVVASDAVFWVAMYCLNKSFVSTRVSVGIAA